MDKLTTETDEAPKKEKKLKNKQLNRDISWLYFNHRLLQEAACPNVPLIERLRFLGIYSNNLDEYYKVRVAGINRLIRLGEKTSSVLYPNRPEKILKQINKIVKEQSKYFDNIYVSIKQELKEKGINIVDEKNLNEEQQKFILSFFENKLINSLHPVILNKDSGFPELLDTNIYLLVDLSKENETCAIVEIPTDIHSRFIKLPGEGNTIILLDDLIRFCLPILFRSLEYTKFRAYTIKLTRDSSIDFTEEVSGDLPDKIIKALKKRKRGIPVRINYDKDMPKRLIKFVSRKIAFQTYDSLISGERYHNFKDFMKFPTLGKTDLVYKKWEPVKIQEIEESDNIMHLVYKKDISIHYPYQDFAYIIRLLREASISSKVKTIKTTLYRLAKYSEVVKALITAAQNGKKVVVIIELFARFDEYANVHWADKMKKAGVDVIFGKKEKKVHSKLIYIEKKGGNIACISTGNFHEGNAKVYTDISIITANKEITHEVAKVFNIIEKKETDTSFKHLLVSPYNMRTGIEELINTEIANAKAGKKAHILCKINHVCDKNIIDKIYEAAEAGVSIEMLIRGNCAIITKDFKNLTIKAIIDRYLEHSRIFIFHNGGKEKCYLSSADWMTRNLDYRIEVATPILDKNIIEQIKTIIRLGLEDTCKARIVDGKGENAQEICPTIKGSQEKLYFKYLKEGS